MWKLEIMFYLAIVAKYGTAELSEKDNMLWDYTASSEDIRNNHIELMKLYMNTSIDPCDDFYEYSCGNWKNANELHSKNQNDVGVLNGKIANILSGFLEGSSEDGNSNEHAFKLFYKSCINTNLIYERGNRPIIDFMKTLDGWPLIDSNTSGQYIDWLNISAKLASYDRKYLLTAYTDPYSEDTSEDPDIIYVKHLYPNHNYFQDDFENITAFIMGEALSETILDEIKVFAESLHNACGGNYGNISIYTLEELLIEEPYIDWQRYLSILLQKHVNSTQKVKAPVNCLKEVACFLSNTPTRIIANYILYTVMSDIVEEYIYLKYMDRTSSGRNEYCRRYTERHFSKSISKTFVDKYLDESANARAIQLSKEVREAFSEFIGNISYIDEPTKQIAQQMVDIMQLKVGYTAKDLENNNFDYLDLKSEEYFENSMKLRQHELKIFWYMEPMKIRDRSFVFEQYEMASFYRKNDKGIGEVFVTAAMLQPPLFHKYFPNWSNYGGFGYILGHEMTHAFDERFIKGRQNELGSEWWSYASFQEYFRRILCYTSQYDKYKFEGTENSVDGRRTLAENMADNGGLKFGYDAYKNWLNNHLDSNENQVNPVLKLSGEQLYFVSFAQSICSSESTERIDRDMYGKYAHPTFRVIGSVSNSNDFAKAFQCPSGSSMNPTIKCQF